MASDNETPVPADPLARNKFNYKTQLTGLSGHPALKSILDPLGDAKFDMASFADSGDYQLPDGLMTELREEAGGKGLDHETRAPDTARILRSLANLMGAVFQQVKEGADKDLAHLPGVLVKLCSENELHQTNGSHAYAILPLNGPAVTTFVSHDKTNPDLLRLRMASSMCSVQPNRLSLVYVYKRGTQFAVQRVPGVSGFTGPLRYLLFSEEPKKPKPKQVVAKRSLAAIESVFQSTENERVSLLTDVISVLAEEKTLASTGSAKNTLMFDVCCSVLIGRRLLFDDSALWDRGNRKAAETVVRWIRDADVGRLFAIEGDAPWSITDSPANITSCCIRFLEVVRHNGAYLTAVEFFERRDVAAAISKLFGELNVPQELLVRFEEHTKQAKPDKKYEWLAACLYLIAVCKFIHRSSPTKNKTIDVELTYNRLMTKDPVFRRSFAEEGPIRAFFIGLAARADGPEVKPATEKKVNRDQEGKVDKKPRASKSGKAEKIQPKKKKTKKPKQSRNRFVDDQADEDSGDECIEVGSSDEEEDVYEDSFIDDESDDKGEDGVVRPNPYVSDRESSEDEDEASHVSGTDEEDMGKKPLKQRKQKAKKMHFTTPVSKKSAVIPDTPARQQEKKPKKSEEGKQETGTKRKLQIVDPESEEEEERRIKDKENKHSRMEPFGPQGAQGAQGAQAEKKEDRTTLLVRTQPVPSSTNTLEIPDIDMPLVHKPPLKQTIKGPAVDSTEPTNQPEPVQQPVKQPTETQYESKIPCSVFPFDDLEHRLNLRAVFEMKRRWAKEDVNETQQFFDIFRDHRMIEYQQTHLRKRLKSLINNDSKKLEFERWTGDRTHECWLVRFKGPSEWVSDTAKQDSVVRDKIIKFETETLGLNPISCPPMKHVLGTHTTLVSLENPASEKPYFNYFFAYCTDGSDVLRISPLAVIPHGDQYAVRTMQYGSDLKNDLYQIKATAPCADGGFGFRNIYLLFVRKDKNVEADLKETFGSIALGIDRFQF